MPSDSTVFVDTNVLLYAQDPRDPVKQQRAASWLDHCWRLQSGRISSQVLHELYANLRRAAPSLSVGDAREVVRLYRHWSSWDVDAATVDEAWLLQDRYGFHYWDALMLAAAHAQGCRWFLSEDLQHGQSIHRLTVINPFLASPEELGAFT